MLIQIFIYLDRVFMAPLVQLCYFGYGQTPRSVVEVCVNVSLKEIHQFKCTFPTLPEPHPSSPMGRPFLSPPDDSSTRCLDCGDRPKRRGLPHAAFLPRITQPINLTAFPLQFFNIGSPFRVILSCQPNTHSSCLWEKQLYKQTSS